MLKSKEVTQLMTMIFGVPVEESNANTVYQDIMARRGMEANFDFAYRNVVLEESKVSIAREIGVSQTMISQRCARARDAMYYRIQDIFPDNEIASYFSEASPRPEIDMFIEFTVSRGITKLDEVLSVSPREINRIFRRYIILQRDKFISRECEKFGGQWGVSRWRFVTVMDGSMSGVEAATGINRTDFYHYLTLESYIEICGCDYEFDFIKRCPHYVETWFPNSGITTASLTDAEFRELFSLNDDEEVIS